jgi:uracil-DNA glycosylase family 4
MNSYGCKQARRFGENPWDAAVMLVGQNPGKEEVKQGHPFVGRSGQYLNKVLQEDGLDRSKPYLTGVVKYRMLTAEGLRMAEGRLPLWRTFFGTLSE